MMVAAVVLEVGTQKRKVFLKHVLCATIALIFYMSYLTFTALIQSKYSLNFTNEEQKNWVQLGPIDRKWWNLKKKSYWYIYVLLFVIMTFEEEDVELLLSQARSRDSMAT